MVSQEVEPGFLSFNYNMSYDYSSRLKKYGDPAINSSKNIAKKPRSRRSISII